jgi:hypothetical protein
VPRAPEFPEFDGLLSYLAKLSVQVEFSDPISGPDSDQSDSRATSDNGYQIEQRKLFLLAPQVREAAEPQPRQP